jgi:hypothetical protein
MRVNRLNPRVAHFVRRLWIRVDECRISDTFKDTLFRQEDPWRYVLRYREGYHGDRRLDEDLIDGERPKTQKKSTEAP